MKLDITDDPNAKWPSDGVYQVHRGGITAGFIMKGGVVVACAPILRKRFEYWLQFATKLAPLKEYKHVSKPRLEDPGQPRALGLQGGSEEQRQPDAGEDDPDPEGG